MLASAVLRSSAARCSRVRTCAQFGTRGVGALQGLVRGDLRGIEETHLVGEFDLTVGIDVEQAREAVQGGFELGAGDDRPLLFVLKLHVGAQGVDAGADAVLLQVGGLVVERLGQVHAGLRGLTPRPRPAGCRGTAKPPAARFLRARSSSCARTESMPSWLER